jgi:phosphoribosyl-AMP cyclohydrolase / phosphoribosyl-ATP pyrophosphohydrolase
MNDVQFDSSGLVPAIVRDATTGAILTLAYMNAESLQKTIETGETWFWSRSRNELWHKGETSGNTQRVVHIATDCDNDALVVSVSPSGPACHTGAMSCFSDVPAPPLDLAKLMRVLRDRYESRPEGSYSASLFNAGRERIVKKVGEETTEVVIAALSEGRERVVAEVADLVFHVSVLLIDVGIDWSEIGAELGKRAR